MRGPRRPGAGRRGIALAAILVIGAALFVFLFVLYLRRTHTIGQIRVELQRQRAYYLARAGAARVLHKMERTLWVVYEMLRKRREAAKAPSPKTAAPAPPADGSASVLVLPRDGSTFLDGMRSCKVQYGNDGARGEYDVEEVRIRLILVGEGEERHEALSVKIRCTGVVREGVRGVTYRKELEQSFVLKIR